MKGQRKGFVLVVLAFSGFVSLGLPDGLLGVAWPSIRNSFDLPIDALGALLVMFTAGYVVASFTSGRILSRINVGALLALSCLATGMSLLGYSVVPRWWLMVALGALAGMGAGAIDAGLNAHAARHYSPRMLNWLHASYGAGAALGPVLMTRVMEAGHRWQYGYALVAFSQLALAGCFAVTARWWTDPQTPTAAAPQMPARSTLRLAGTWAGIAVFFIYTGLEAAVGLWAFSLFTEARGIDPMTAGFWVSIYWASLTIGRVLSGFIVHYIPVRTLLRVCIACIGAGAALLWLNLTAPLSFFGLVLMGLAAAPVFPSMIATTPDRLGRAHTENAVGYQIAGAVLGQSFVPALLGVVAAAWGLEIAGPALLAGAVVLWASFEISMACFAAGPAKFESSPAES